MLNSHKRRSARQPDFVHQTATILRWLVWGVIFAMLGVMIYRAVPVNDESASVEIPAPLPEGQRPKLDLDREKLAGVEDDAPFRAKEKDAWFEVMDLLRSTPEETLRQASLGPVTWIQLFNQPKVYRGEPITLVGRVRRAHRLNTPKKYYQLWFQPNDNRDERIAVHCLELPKDFPLGMAINEPVVLTGIFFKRLAYRGQVDLVKEPLVLANSLQWTPQPKMTEQGMPLTVTNLVTIVVVALVLSVAFVLFWHFRTRRPKQTDLPEEIEISDKLFEVKSFNDEVEEDGEAKEFGDFEGDAEDTSDEE